MRHAPTLLALISLVLIPGGGYAEPGGADSGATIVYASRPGDTPSSVAEMFGVPAEEFAAFLRSNGVKDATHVPVGFRYRIPDPLGSTVRRLEARNAELASELTRSATWAEQLDAELRTSREAAEAIQAERARLRRLEWLWPLARAGLVALVLACFAAVSLAVAAAHRAERADRYAQSLGAELERKRQANLADRQESTRRVQRLEARIRELSVRATLGAGRRLG